MACVHCAKKREVENTIKAFGGEVSEDVSKRNTLQKALLTVIGIVAVPFVCCFVVGSVLFNKGMVKIPFLKL